MPASTFQRAQLLAMLTCLTCAAACGDSGGKGKDAGATECTAKDCEGMEVPAIACADGPTLIVCERGSDGQCHASVRCGDDAGVSDGGTAGETCGGIAGLGCSKGLFCNYEVEAGGNGCTGIADAAGVCESLPTQCADLYLPVCGCDYRTHANACEAHALGVSVMHAGACTPAECTTSGGRPEYSDGASTPMCKASENGFEIAAEEPALCCLPAEPSDLKWYRTCGAPVCGSPNQPPSGLPACDTQVEGVVCTDEGSECDLGDDCSTHLICAKTDPTQGPGGCPISRADSKMNIRYLEAADLAQKHDEVLGLSLAEYTYKSDPRQEPRLGFIIEDVEPSVFVEEARNRVDLYAYTSAVIAALKVQEARIRELEAQVHKLSAKLTAQRKARAQ